MRGRIILAVCFLLGVLTITVSGAHVSLEKPDTMYRFLHPSWASFWDLISAIKNLIKSVLFLVELTLTLGYYMILRRFIILDFFINILIWISKTLTPGISGIANFCIPKLAAALCWADSFLLNRAFTKGIQASTSSFSTGITTRFVFGRNLLSRIPAYFYTLLLLSAVIFYISRTTTPLTQRFQSSSFFRYVRALLGNDVVGMQVTIPFNSIFWIVKAFFGVVMAFIRFSLMFVWVNILPLLLLTICLIAICRFRGTVYRLYHQILISSRRTWLQRSWSQPRQHRKQKAL